MLNLQDAVEYHAGLVSALLVVASNLLWRFHGCRSRGWVPHDKRWRAMQPLCIAPADTMKRIERLAIKECRAAGVPLANVGAGGERIGTDYICFLYVVHNDHTEAFDMNGLMRFRASTCSCE